jgi:hypothetical protein
MRKPVAHCIGRGGDVHHRGQALKPMVAGLVEQVADRDDAAAFQSKIRGQPRGAAAQYPCDRIQFPAPTRKVPVRHVKVGTRHATDGGKQDRIFTIPKTVFVLFSSRRLRFDHRRGC